MGNSVIELHTEVPVNLQGNVFGQFDEHLKLIRTLNVTLIFRSRVENSGRRGKCISGASS